MTSGELLNFSGIELHDLWVPAGSKVWCSPYLHAAMLSYKMLKPRGLVKYVVAMSFVTKVLQARDWAHMTVFGLPRSVGVSLSAPPSSDEGPADAC